eukprot:1757149-Pleurochrysis_carterae.AAC.2
MSQSHMGSVSKFVHVSAALRALLLRHASVDTAALFHQAAACARVLLHAWRLCRHGVHACARGCVQARTDAFRMRASIPKCVCACVPASEFQRKTVLVVMLCGQVHRPRATYDCNPTTARAQLRFDCSSAECSSHANCCTRRRKASASAALAVTQPLTSLPYRVHFHCFSSAAYSDLGVYW